MALCRATTLGSLHTTIAGAERPFHIGYRALRRAKKNHGITLNLNDVQTQASEDWLEFFFTMLHIGLLHGDETITREQVEDWVDDDEAFDDAAATELVMGGVSQIFESGDKGNPPKAPAK